MTIDAFKIKGKFVKITELSKERLISKIPLLLKEDGYNIIDSSDSKIDFKPTDDSFSRLRGFASQRVYQGSFIILENGKNVQLELIYFIPYTFFLLAIIISLIMGILSDPIDFVLGFFALVFFLIDFFKRKHIARQLFFELINNKD